MKRDKIRQDEPPRKEADRSQQCKKPYSAPVLSRLGDMKNVTLGGGGCSCGCGS